MDDITQIKVNKDNTNEKINNKKRHYEELITFLNNCRGGDKITHTFIQSINGFQGKFNITPDIKREFVDLYKKNIFCRHLHIVEVQKEVGPLVIDIDLKYKNNTRYTPSIVVNIVELIIDIINKYYCLPDDKFKIFVFEKEKTIQKDELYKDGIHLQLPFVAFHKKMRYVILEELGKAIKDNFILEDLNLVSEDDVVDLSVAYRNNWLMYGGRKPNNIPYKLTKIFNSCLIEEPIIYSDSNLVDILSIHKYNNNDLIDVRPEIKNDICFSNKLENCEKKDKKTDKMRVVKHNNITKKICQDNVDLAKKLLVIIDIKRAENYYDWLRIGWCLFDIGLYELLDAYKEFSKKAPHKYTEGCCEKVFADATINEEYSGYTIATLKWYACQDNKDAYVSIMLEHLERHLHQALLLTDSDIAKYIYEKYKDVIVKTPDDMWHTFENGKWISNKLSYKLNNLIYDEVVKDVYSLRIKYDEKAKYLSEEERISLLKKIEPVNKLIKRLSMRTSKKSIVAEAGDMMINEDFYNTLNSNKNLVGFNNGVYDLEHGVFREASPTDRITKTVRYKYVPVSEDSEEWKDLEKYFEQVFTDEELRRYALKFMASCLDGSTRDQKFHFWTGCGANGKSTTISLLQHTLGDYYAPVDVTLLTKKEVNAASANPALMALKGLRAGCMQECGAKDELNMGRLKQLTGDSVTVRTIFKEQETWKPECKLFLTCNRLPDIREVDNGTWRRVAVICFESEFVDKEDIVDPTRQFEKDPDLENDIGKKWHLAFMSMLLKYYKIYKNEGLVQPNSVKKHTANYRSNNDVFKEFSNMNLVITKNNEDKEDATAVYNNFKTIVIDTIPGFKCPKKSEFIDYLLNNMKVSWDKQKDLIYGIKLISK